MFAAPTAHVIHVSEDQHQTSGTGSAMYVQYMLPDGSTSQWQDLYLDQDVWEDVEDVPEEPTVDKPSTKHYANSVCGIRDY